MPSHTVVAGDIAASCASLYSPTTEVSARDMSGDVTAMHSVGSANLRRGPTSAQRSERCPWSDCASGCGAVSGGLGWIPATSETRRADVLSGSCSELSCSAVDGHSGTSTGLQRSTACARRLLIPRESSPTLKTLIGTPPDF